ncbi:NADPH:quinone reductase [Acaromyces ingoldii]|uniref:NADPH:quinone reductase n=1 Tax=Acaromyces ingoldii TaxID=215250 RepID=A0A316YL16_9BASI|nr:NADPH:quinone reductase [Acaromyces ingoldii]PWN88753.1 NADPH:quinone reductase [Acaromyces ingoldii]
MTMKAVRLHEFGGPEVLRYEDAPRPQLKPGEVLVRVHAVGINPPDWYLRDGFKSLPADWRPPVPLPAIPGTDVSGVVDSVGADAQGFSAGDEVFAMVRFPSFGESAAYAQYVAVPASDLALKPAGLDHVHAAAAPMAALTAWQFLIERGHEEPNPLQQTLHNPVPIGAGTTVLVNGAAGGVGHMALQLAKWKGARVIAVASGAHETFLRGLGADEFIDYTKTRPEEAVRDVDLVLDAVGGPKSGRFLRTLKRGGALFPVFISPIDAEELERHGVTASITQVRSSGKQLAELGRLLEAGTIRVAVDSTFSLADANKAHERAGRGHIQGKIVLTVD